jgi:Zn-finger nucleic acid-binding protein
MQVTPVQGVSIDTCEFCRGQFFDSFEVDRALEFTSDQSQRLQCLESPVPTDTSDGQPLSCPGCRQMMRTWELPGPPKVWLDRCRNCKGIWLDGGECRKLLQALAAAGSPIGCNDARSAGSAVAQGQSASVAPRPSSKSNVALGLFFSLLDFIVPGD